MLWEVDIVPVIGAGATTRAKRTEARIGAAEVAVAVAGGGSESTAGAAATPASRAATGQVRPGRTGRGEREQRNGSEATDGGDRKSVV